MHAAAASIASTTISTCEVYGDLPLDSDEAFTEESPYRPRTPYNASKAGADHAVRAYLETFGLPVTITNCSNNYGPYQFPEKVIPLFLTNALDDQRAAALRLHRRTGASGYTWTTTAARSSLVLARGRAGRDVQRRLRGRALDRGDRRPACST